MTDIQECCICFEVIGTTNTCTTPCNHTFCLRCIIMTMKNSHTCPCCRTPLRDEDREEDEYEDDEEEDDQEEDDEEEDCEEEDCEDDDEEEEEDEDEDEEEENEKEELEPPIEKSVQMLEKEGYGIMEMTSIVLGRIFPNVSYEEYKGSLSRFDDLMDIIYDDYNKEQKEIKNMMKEDSNII